MEAQREENPRGVRASSKAGVGVPQIIDIRSDTAGIELKQQIQAGLKSEGEKTLPTLLLYNEQGLRLFERITYLDQYYLTGEEINVLEQYADRMVERIPSGGMLVELGSGYENCCCCPPRRALRLGRR